MEDNLKKYIEKVFSGVPHTEKAESAKAEILQNLLDKYHDLLATGANESMAYNASIASLGDLSGIVKELKECDEAKKLVKREQKKCKNFESLLWPITLCLYLGLSFFGGRIGTLSVWAVSWILFVLAGAVSSLYHFLVRTDRKRKNECLSSFVWTLATALYFILSFVTRRWDITWILFIIAIPTDKILHLICLPEEEEE